MASNLPVGEPLVDVVRDGAVESLHAGHLVVVDGTGDVRAALGAPASPVYARSALKPFQALATVELLAAAGRRLEASALALICASHTGSLRHQAAVREILADAGLDVDDLGCPPALPEDAEARGLAEEPTRLAHNCSGKHAGFLAAQVAAGGDAAAYLDPDSRIQECATAHLRAQTCELVDRGVDGCGAPAWRLPLHALATGFARLARTDPEADPKLATISMAMRTHPTMVGGASTTDALLMRADDRVVAKRGAEACFAAGVSTPDGRGLGVAVKITDGGARATGPAVGAVLRALGCQVDDAVATPVVLGGSVPHGLLRPTPALAQVCATLAKAS